MKLLQVGSTHQRNEEFIKRACTLFQIEYHFTHSTNFPDKGYDIIWCPGPWVNPDTYPSSKFIFGPGCWIFPDPKHPFFTESKPEHKSRCIFSCLSDWNVKVYQEFADIANSNIPFLPLPFGLEDIQPKPTIQAYSYDCIIYHKHRDPKLLEYCKSVVESKGLTYKVYTYGSYQRYDYIETLKKVRFAIWLGSHESQGFALQECLATNTPIYVYEVKTMKEEFYSNFNYTQHKEQLLATSAPYWSNLCGYKVYSNEEFAQKLDAFVHAIPQFNPAKYVQETLTDRVCFQRFLDAFQCKSKPMKTVVLVWKQEYYNYTRTNDLYFWGIGDMLRGAYGMFNMSKEMNFRLIVDYSLHPISKFFKGGNHKFSSLVKEKQGEIPVVFPPEKVIQYITKGFENSDVILMYTGHETYAYDTTPTAELKTFMKSLLIPTDEFQSYIDAKLASLPSPDFSILHYRLGDDELVRKTVPDHNRFIKHLIDTKQSTDILLSDSMIFKNQIANDMINIVMFRGPIGHIGVHTDRDALQHTLFELILLSKASSIRSFSIYVWISGFVHAISMIYDIPLHNMLL